MIRIKTFKLPFHILALMFVAFVLASCGGGGGGNNDDGSDSTTTIPNIPSDLNATTVSDTSISLSWMDNSDDESDFVILQSTTSGSGFVIIDTVAANTTDYTVTGLTASTTYYFRVYASNSAGTSEDSNEASATTSAPPSSPPGAPSGLSATATSSSSISLSWTDNSNNETGFTVQRSTTSGTGFTTIATLGSNITSYVSSGLSASTTYYYRVRASNSAGNSDFSNQANATTSAPPVTPPTAPSGLSAIATSSSSISLSWTDNSNNETGFTVQRSTTSGTGFTTIATLGSNITSYVSSGLSASTTYYYRVRASNSAGNSSFSNQASATTSAPPVTIPSAPSGLSATATSTSSISLSWSDNSSNETGFTVQRSTTSGSGFITIATLASNSTSYVSSGLSASTTYYYRVRASNSAGNSSFSNQASATTLSAIVTNTYTVSADNLLITSSQEPFKDDQAFPTAENAVGCNWIYSSVTITQDFVCFISLLYFNVDTDISGKTIISATLKLYPEILPASFTQYQVWATFDNWFSNVTWNTQPQVYSGSNVIFSQPFSSLPSEINVTSIVQNWANGTFNNFGFFVEDVNYAFPFATQLRATGFCSKEGVPSCTSSRAPKLVITYQ